MTGYLSKLTHKTAVAKYHQDKDSSQDSMAFPATVSMSNTVHTSENYSGCFSSWTCSRCSLTHSSSSCCPSSSVQYSRCSHLNHLQHMCHTQKPSGSPSRRGDNRSRERYHFRSHHKGGRNQYPKG